jgi:hypothetical protein
VTVSERAAALRDGRLRPIHAFWSMQLTLTTFIVTFFLGKACAFLDFLSLSFSLSDFLSLSFSLSD